MEALFSLSVASYEAWLLLLCLIVFIGIYIFDGITFVQRVIDAFTPKTVSLPEVPAEDVVVESPILVPIAPEEVQAHKEQKILEAEKEIEEKETERQEMEVLAQEKVLEESSPYIDDANVNEDAPDIESIDTIWEDEWAEEKNEEHINIPESIEEVTMKEEEWDKEGYTETVDEEKPEDESEWTQEEVAQRAISEEENDDELIESEVLPTENITGDIEEISRDVIPEEIIDNTEEIVQEELIEEEEREIKKITDSIPEKITEPKKAVDSTKTEKLYTIVNEVKTLIARGNTIEARWLIIEWLSINKNHRELNLILGSLYEWDRHFQKAEYVYKDLAIIYPEDGEILERLGNILIIQKRYDIAFEIYKKIVDISWESEWTLYIMTHLVHELGHQEELYAYARRYQKNWPNNPEILGLLAESEIALWERASAIQTLIKLKNLTPYNNEIMQTIAQLTMEEELAGNFGNK